MTKHPLDEAFRGLPAGTLIDGRYRVVRPICQGRAGFLHEVEHVRTGRRLALKTLHPNGDPAQLEQEARAAGLMKNSHAVKVTDMGVGDGAGPYLVLDLVEGQSLRAFLDERQQLPVALSVNLALQLCECLSEAHNHGFIHGDLRPECVLVAPIPLPSQYDVKVLDFGVAVLHRDGAAPGSPVARAASMPVETPCYASPEQIQDMGAPDARDDVYTIGVLLYECLSGRRPFEGETLDDLVRTLRTTPPAPLRHLRPDVPAEVCNTTMRAISIRREDRQVSARDVATALLPHGDATLGRWLRIEDRRSEVARPPPPAKAAHGDAEPTAVNAGPPTVRPETPPHIDAEPTETDAPRADSAPTTTHWNIEAARHAAATADEAWIDRDASALDSVRRTEPLESGPEQATSAWTNDACSPGAGDGGVDEARAGDSDPPTAAWSNAAARAAVGPDPLRNGGRVQQPGWGGMGAQPPAPGAGLPAVGAPSSHRFGWPGSETPGTAASAARSAETKVSAGFEATVLARKPPQRPFIDIATDTRRDTPTEMYRKSDVGPPSSDIGKAAPLEMSPSARDAMQAPFHPSPYAGAPPPGEGADARSPLPSEEKLLTELPSAAPLAPPVAGAYATLRIHPTAPFPSGTPYAAKPGWQRSLDKALVRAGDGLERRLKGPVHQLMDATPGVQIALAVIAGCVVVLLVLASIYLLVMR